MSGSKLQIKSIDIKLNLAKKKKKSILKDFNLKKLDKKEKKEKKSKY